MPGIKAAIPPTFTDVMETFKLGVFYDLYCHLPGTIVSYDRASGTATIQPGLQRVYSSYNPDAPQATAQYQPLLQVPVFFAQAGGVSVGGDPQAGDYCLLCVADRNMDAWRANGGAPAPLSPRAHDLSDCFALVGFNPKAAPLNTARLAGEFGLAEAAGGTGAKVVIKAGKVSVANATENLATILTTFLNAVASSSVLDSATKAAATAAAASLAALLY
jgi:hypothetical protein